MWDRIYAYSVVMSGALLGLVWAVQMLVSLYQLWLPPKKPAMPEAGKQNPV